MSDFIGCIILESLNDESIMSDVLIEDEKDCEAPPGDRFSVWRQRLIRVPSDKAESFAKRLSRAMIDGYYTHYFDEKNLYVVFTGRYFVLPKGKDSSWDEMISFGETVGVGPDYTETIPVEREMLLG